MTHAPKPGDYVEITTSEEKLSGMLLKSPQLEKDIVIVKLDSGYNLGIDRKKVSKIELMQQKVSSIKEGVAKKAVMNKKLPKISILHTGGTIASKVDYRTGGVISRFTPEELIEMLPSLNDIANINSRLIRNMWSEDMRYGHYNIMAKEVEKEVKKGVDGIVITHGTDTMHYSAAALELALEKVPVPIIIVGSQRSSDRGSTDAALNLVSAVYFAANSDFSGVAICMHENISDNDCLILPAMKTRKMHTSRRDAFRPINAKAIARVNAEGKKVSMIDNNHLAKGKGKLQLKLFNEKLKVGLVKVHPMLMSEQLECFKNYDGLVIEGYALGHAPVNEIDELTKENRKVMDAIKSLAAKMPVVMASQCIYGRLQMNVYQTGRDLQAAGVLGHLHDMTPETTLIKLAWLLSNFKKDDVPQLITKNLRGEISERTEESNFLN